MSDRDTAQRRLQTYRFFKQGHDTLTIARTQHRDEPGVLRDISMARSAFLGRPYPYPPFQQPSVSAFPKTAFREAAQ